MWKFGKNKPANDPTALFAGEDPEMLAAIRTAQSSFPDFLAKMEMEVRRVVPAYTDCLVKYALDAHKAGVVVEHVFVSDLWMEDGKLRGLLASEPQNTDAVRAGDEIEINPARVSDWLYVENGVGVGGATFRVMWKRFSPAEKAAYRDQPPFVWLKELA